jgi:hypothetical protein
MAATCGPVCRSSPPARTASTPCRRAGTCKPSPNCWPSPLHGSKPPSRGGPQASFGADHTRDLPACLVQTHGRPPLLEPPTRDPGYGSLAGATALKEGGRLIPSQGLQWPPARRHHPHGQPLQIYQPTLTARQAHVLDLLCVPHLRYTDPGQRPTPTAIRRQSTPHAAEQGA